MSMSNRALRMAQHHLRNRADAELNLIPLIDILSVMAFSFGSACVFRLVSESGSVRWAFGT